MEGDPTVHHQVLSILVHVPVHLLVDQPEDNGLIAHQGLVVRFGIANGLFVGPFGGKFLKNFRNVPGLIGLFFDGFDPVIGSAHGQAVRKTNTSVFYRNSQSGITAHILCYGKGSRSDFLYHFIGQGEVGDGIFILSAIKIEIIRGKIPFQTMIIIEHAGYPVEPEAIEAKLCKPVVYIGEQKMAYLIFAIIEAEGIPGHMLPPVIAMEELGRVTIQQAQALVLIFYCVRVDDIHNHSNTVPVGLVNKLLQFLRGTESGAGGKKIRDMVSK